MHYLVIFLTLMTLGTSAWGEVEFDIGGDAYVRWFSRQNIPLDPNGYPGTNERKHQGFAQMARLKIDLVHEEGVALRTRTLLAGDKWSGDIIEAGGTRTLVRTPPVGSNGVQGNTDDGRGGYNVRLDYGFLEYRKLGWLFRAGRQESNWAECLTNCDDRRDRLLVLRPMWDGFVIAVYDKRKAGDYHSDSDDADMYGLAYLRYAGPLEYGVLLARWENPDKSYLLTGVNNISPYVKYRRGNFDSQVLANYVGQGSSKSSFPDHHYAYALRLGHQLTDRWRFDTQTLQVHRGGYLSIGYDTYLSMVNNNPEHNQSNQMSTYLGGLGNYLGFLDDKDHREYLYSLRTQYKATSKLTLGLAGGILRKHQPLETFKMTPDFKFIYETRNLHFRALDLTAHYQLTSNASLRANVGRLFGSTYNLSAAAINFEASFE
jgi:hypothetical protein